MNSLASAQDGLSGPGWQSDSASPDAARPFRASIDRRDSGLVPEILDLYSIGAFSVWEWSRERNGLATLGELRADSLEEWMLRIHPRDQSAFSAFLDRDWTASPCASIDYRIHHGLAGEWLRVRHTAFFSERGAESRLSGLVEKLSSPHLTRTLLERTEEELREGEANYTSCLRYLLEGGGREELGSVLERVRKTLRAELVALVPQAAARTGGIVGAAATLPGLVHRESSLAEDLSIVFAGIDPSDRLPWIEIDRDPATERTAWIAACPLRDGKGAVVAALCAGFGSETSRVAGRRLAVLLALAADPIRRRLLEVEDDSIRREFLDHLRETLRFAGRGRLLDGLPAEISGMGTNPRDGGGSIGLKTEEDSAAETCDLNQAMKQFAETMGSLLRLSVSLDLDLDPGIGPVRSDEGILRELVLALLLESLDSAPTAGSIAIATRRAVVFGSEPSPYASLRLGEPAPSARPARKLAGFVDLEALAAQQGGRLEAYTTPQGGLGFELLLPLARPAASEESRTMGSGTVSDPGRALREATILLVEDEAAVRKLVRKLLERLGCKVVEAKSGREALEIWPEVRERITLVVSDVVMPDGVSGWDLAEQLHRLHPGLGILLTSGHGDRPEDRGLGGIERIGFLQKPYGADVLHSALCRLAEAAA